MKYHLLLLFISLWSFTNGQVVRLEIPIELYDGLGKGIAEYSMPGLTFVDWDTYIWKDLILAPKGFPEDWTENRFGIEFLNQPQFIYQYSYTGQIQEGYMLDNWLDDAQFTEVPIRCYLLFAEGIDSEGNRRFVVDGNNNGDLSDDTFFYADSMTFERGRKEIRIEYDAYLKGEVVKQKRTMYVGYDLHNQMYFGKVAEYATCSLNEVGYMLSPFGHNYMIYEEFEIIPLAAILPGEHTHFMEQPVRKGEYLKVGDNWYCFKTVNVNRQVVVLEKDNRLQSEILAMQTGFRPYPFFGLEFTSKDSLSLDRYKGKNLLLMVWSPGCSSCIDKLFPMNEIYKAIDVSKVALLGMALHVDEEQFSLIKDEYAIDFPLMIGEPDKINEAYLRLNTPTFFLINPDGVIIMKTFNLDEIKRIVLEL